MMTIRQSLFFGIFFVLISSVFAVNMNVSITETSKVTKLINGQYSITAQGVLTVMNPSNVSSVYDFRLPITFDALLGISKIPLDNSSNYFTFSHDKISGQILHPLQKAQVGYTIYGILTSNIYPDLVSSNKSVLEYYSSSFEFSSQLILSLDKPQREGEQYDMNGSLIQKVPTTSTTRVVGANIRNPSDFSFDIKEIKIFKSLTSDPMFSDSKAVKTFYNMSLNPFGSSTVDFTDTNSNESSVYWVSSLTYIVPQFFESVSREYYVQTKADFKKVSGSGGGGMTFFKNTTVPLSTVILRKSVQKNLLDYGDEVKVTLQFVNVDQNTLYNVTLSDEFPIDDYEIKDVSQNVKISGRNMLEFSLKQIEGYETFELTYTLVNKKKSPGITYLKPAKATFFGGEAYSQGILLVNAMLADKKVYIQKEVKYVDNNYAKVTITVKNLGNIPLNDILVTDNMDTNAIIKDISQTFYERGVWKITELKAGGEWVVTYLVERNPTLDTLPSVFGVEKSQVFGTLISSDEVVTVFSEEPKLVEKVGLGLAVGLLVFYLLF